MPNIMVKAGGIANFEAGINGLPETYTWYQIDSTGKTTLVKTGISPFLTVSPVSAASAGRYFAVVTDSIKTAGHPSVQTPEAILTISPAGE